jgi:hypothetical protein
MQYKQLCPWFFPQALMSECVLSKVLVCRGMLVYQIGGMALQGEGAVGRQNAFPPTEARFMRVLQLSHECKVF